MDAVKLFDDLNGFFMSENGGETFGTFGSAEEEGFDILVKNFAVEEEDGAEGLVLGGCGDVSFDGEVGDEGMDLGCAHFFRVFFVMKEYIAADPVYVGFFGAIRVVFGAEGVGELFE